MTATTSMAKQTPHRNRFLPIVSAVCYATLLLKALHIFFLGPLQYQAAQMVRYHFECMNL
jgi:hypothetical protein